MVFTYSGNSPKYQTFISTSRKEEATFTIYATAKFSTLFTKSVKYNSVRLLSVLFKFIKVIIHIE